MILASHAGGSSCFLSPYAIYIQKSYLITLSADQRWRMFNFVYLFILLTFFVGTCLTFRETPIYVVRLTSVLPRKMAKFRPAPEVDVPASANTTKIPKKKKNFYSLQKVVHLRSLGLEVLCTGSSVERFPSTPHKTAKKSHVSAYSLVTETRAYYYMHRC